MLANGKSGGIESLLFLAVQVQREYQMRIITVRRIVDPSKIRFVDVTHSAKKRLERCHNFSRIFNRLPNLDWGVSVGNQPLAATFQYGSVKHAFNFLRQQMLAIAGEWIEFKCRGSSHSELIISKVRRDGKFFFYNAVIQNPFLRCENLTFSNFYCDDAYLDSFFQDVFG